MKKYIAGVLTLGLAVLAQASIIPFDLSPADTDGAVGLSPLNEVPALTNSAGSGNTISGGIAFDTDTGIMSFLFGYGSAAGFTDLTGPVTAINVQGPAGPGTNAAGIYNLMQFNFAASDPAKGGLVYAQVAIQTNEVDNLLAGLHYLNLCTASNLDGEIRGQLIPRLNHPPVIVCPEPSTVECGGPATLTAKVSDPDGDALVVVWSVNSVAIQTNNLAAGSTTTPAAVVFTAEFPLGTNSVAVAITDSKGNAADCSTTVTVVDTIPPVITKVAATPNMIWPPNHKMVPVKVTALVTDVCGPTTWKITSITCNEAVNAKGSGKTAPDWQITGPCTANVRAERSGITGPRIYTITVEATDASGNVSAPKTVTVTVPHDLRLMFAK